MELEEQVLNLRIIVETGTVAILAAVFVGVFCGDCNLAFNTLSAILEMVRLSDSKYPLCRSEGRGIGEAGKMFHSQANVASS